MNTGAITQGRWWRGSATGLVVALGLLALPGVAGPSPSDRVLAGATVTIVPATIVGPGTPGGTLPPSSATATPFLFATATPGGGGEGTATALAATATSVSLTATAVAWGGTMTSVQQTQTALAATQTALAGIPSTTSTPPASATATHTRVPCQDAYDPAGSPAGAQALVLGEPQHRIFCPAGEADWATFFGKAGKAYRITTSELSAGVDTYLNLFAPDGQTLLVQNDDAPGQQGPSLLLFVPPADGWYFVQAKNQGDIGFPGAGYTLALSLTDLPSTATGTATPVAASATPTPLLAAPTSSPLGPAETPTAPIPAPPTLSTSSPTATPDSLLHVLSGGPESGGLPVYDAGPGDAMATDLLEPNDSFDAARPLEVGAKYLHLNFVPLSATPDADFYAFRTKPGDCYAVTTGDLSPGLDTTILLWQTAPTREGRRLLAQDDDARPHTADLSSSVRWCNPTSGPDDLWLVAEIHHYGQAPATDPRGKSYSLVVQIDPPTPMATPTPRPPSPGPAPGGGGPPVFPNGPPVATQPPVLPALPPPPAIPATATALPAPHPVLPAVSPMTAVGSTTPTGSGISPTPSPTATATPATVQVDVVAYVASADVTDPNQGPQPDDGIQGVAVLLIDAPTNAVVQTATTDTNGHAALRWTWNGSVRVALPAFRWSRTLTQEDIQRESQGTGRLYLEARSPSYPLPGIFP